MHFDKDKGLFVLSPQDVRESQLDETIEPNLDKAFDEISTAETSLTELTTMMAEDSLDPAERRDIQLGVMRALYRRSLMSRVADHILGISNLKIS